MLVKKFSRFAVLKTYDGKAPLIWLARLSSSFLSILGKILRLVLRSARGRRLGANPFVHRRGRKCLDWPRAWDIGVGRGRTRRRPHTSPRTHHVATDDRF
jgi:hypothetical protein